MLLAWPLIRTTSASGTIDTCPFGHIQDVRRCSTRAAVLGRRSPRSLSHSDYFLKVLMLCAGMAPPVIAGAEEDFEGRILSERRVPGSLGKPVKEVLFDWHPTWVPAGQIVRDATDEYGSDAVNPCSPRPFLIESKFDHSLPRRRGSRPTIDTTKDF